VGKIIHCGKSIPVLNRYAVSSYPSYGDITYFDHAICGQCGNAVHSYRYVYFRKKEPTEVWLSNKHNRHVFQRLIDEGQAYIIPAMQEEVPHNTRAQVLAGEWTLKITRPADVTALYLARNERAPWVSNRAQEYLRRKRERWLSEYSKAKR
jgi:hypothetical protein